MEQYCGVTCLFETKLYTFLHLSGFQVEEVKKKDDSLLKNILEDVLEAAIVGLQNSVLGAQVERPLLANSILEAAVGKSSDGLKKQKSK